MASRWAPAIFRCRLSVKETLQENSMANKRILAFAALMNALSLVAHDSFVLYRNIHQQF